MVPCKGIHLQHRTRQVKIRREINNNFTPYAGAGQFGQYKLMQKQWLKPWHMGTHLSSQRELSNEYQHDRVSMDFKSASE